MKTVFKGFSILAIFLAFWLLLSQIDYVTFFKIDKARNSTEKRIGDVIWDDIKSTETIVVNDTMTKTLDKLLKKLCKENGINRDSLKVHIVEKEEINAFALPDSHLVVYTGLIKASKNESALIGVLGHEIAHIEKNHVMKKLSKEVGISVLLSLTTGSDGRAMREVLHALSSSAYDRELEKEADLASVEYMLKANVNPAPFADFLYEMSFDNNKLGMDLSWLSDHPAAEERAKYVLEYIKGKKLKSKDILSKQEWEAFKLKVNKDY